MVLDRIFEDEVRKAMREKGIEQIATPLFGWSGRYKVLVIVEKKKEFYEVYGVRVYISDDKMHRVSMSKTVRNVRDIGTVMDSVAKNTADQWIEGYAIRDPYTTIHMLFTAEEGDQIPKKSVLSIQEILPEIHTHGSVIGYICDQNLQITNNPILLSEKMLLHHVVITGSTGGGKTEAAKRIVTEIEKMRKKALVITPEAHLWGKLENINFLGDDDAELTRGINVVDCTNVKDFAEEASRVIESVIEHYGKMEQTDNLRLLLVIDEAHLFIGQKNLENVLESATRILRKFGVSCVLLSHTYADFNRGIRSNVQTHIALYTNWARDLSFIKAFQADGTVDYSKLLLSMPEGYGIFRSRDFLRNQPVPCKFLKPYEVLQTTELKQVNDKQIDETYQRRVDILEVIRKNPDVTAEEIQLKLKRRGIQMPNSTLYNDLDWLEGQKLVEVTHVEERGKKHYATRQ